MGAIVCFLTDLLGLTPPPENEDCVARQCTLVIHAQRVSRVCGIISLGEEGLYVTEGMNRS